MDIDLKGRVAPGTTSDRVTGSEDWLPTLLELAGAAASTPPRVDGLSFARRFRALGRPTPMVMLSGQGGEDVVIAALDAGFNAFVPKPVTGHMLADAIEGFPVPFYPRCLQRAHENAALVDFDLDILQAGVFDAIRESLGRDSQALDDDRNDDACRPWLGRLL